MLATVLVVATIPAAVVLVFKASKWIWNRRVAEFCTKHDGYATATSETRRKKEVLLIVCPTSGNGRAMTFFKSSVKGLEALGRLVEVYVTKSKEDLMALAETKDLKPYATIAILAGDSSVFEFVQQPMLKNNGKWPFAPILHLPGGSGNALPREFYGPEMIADIRGIIEQARTIRKISTIKAENKEGTVRYALHNCFDGVQTAWRDWLDEHRCINNFLGFACGFAVNVLLFFTIYPFRRNLNLMVLNVCNSDFEGGGIDYGFGITRFDKNMAVVFSDGASEHGRLKLVKAYAHFMSGKLAKDIKDDEKDLPYDLHYRVCDRFTTRIPSQNYKLYFDGSSSLPLKGNEISFVVIPDSVPFFTIPK